MKKLLGLLERGCFRQMIVGHRRVMIIRDEILRRRFLSSFSTDGTFEQQRHIGLLFHVHRVVRRVVRFIATHDGDDIRIDVHVDVVAVTVAVQVEYP